MTEMNETTVPVVQLAKDNDEFRKVIMTGEQTQVVLMAIPAGEEIGGEVHEGHDQLLMFVAGEGLAKIGDVATTVTEGDLSFVPSGVFHNFKNTGSGPLKLYTTYSPPEHEEGTEHATKSEADASH